MSKIERDRVAREAAQLIAHGVESEYLDAKERAVMMLGLSSQTCLPSNSKIKEYVSRLTKDELGEMAVAKRIKEMRLIALALMKVLQDYDPFLIGSTLSGKIRKDSDIDIHVYCDNPEELQELLLQVGYEDVELDMVDNSKGRFYHLKWIQNSYPVELTVYGWEKREIVPTSSITGKPMKRADLKTLERMMK